MKVTKLFAAAALACATAVPMVGSPMLAFADSPSAAATPPHGFPTGTHFTSLDYTSDGGFVGPMFRHVEINIDEQGAVLYKRIGQPDVTGQATKTELARLNAAWRSAHLGIGDTKVPGIIPDLPTLTLKYGFCGNAFHMCSTGSVSGERLTPGAARMVAAMQRVAERVASTHATSFSNVSLHIENPMSLYNAVISVDSTGKIVYNPPHNRPVINGQATPAELDALKRAVSRAQVDTLPANVSNWPVPDGSTFDIKTEVAGKSYDTQGFYMRLGNYASRVQPVLNAFQAIQNRLEHVAPATTPGLSGGVSSTSHP
jgi:hypothetical protein